VEEVQKLLPALRREPLNVQGTNLDKASRLAVGLSSQSRVELAELNLRHLCLLRPLADTLELAEHLSRVLCVMVPTVRPRCSLACHEIHLRPTLMARVATGADELIGSENGGLDGLVDRTKTRLLGGI